MGVRHRFTGNIITISSGQEPTFNVELEFPDIELSAGDW
jgi:hypothetical protein